MYADATPLLVGIIILLASLISLRLGLSVAIIEIVLGTLFGNLGVIHVQDWMVYGRVWRHPSNVSGGN